MTADLGTLLRVLNNNAVMVDTRTPDIASFLLKGQWLVLVS